MIQSIMFFALGFFVAGLIGVLLAPALSRRAARLTQRRIESTTPVRMADIQADKDQMRAEFAMTARKLEMSVEDLKKKASQRLVEIGRKEETVDRLRTELSAQRETGAEMSQRIEQLQSNVAALEKQLREQHNQVAEKERLVGEGSEKQRNMQARYDELAATADGRKVEIVALKTRIQNLEDKLNNAERKLASRDAEATTFEARAKELEKSVKEFTGDNDRLMRENRKLTDQAERSEQQVQRRRDEIVELKRELNAAKANAKEGESALKGAEAKIIELRSSTGEAEKSQRQAKSELSRREKEFLEREQELAKKQKELEARIEKVASEKSESDVDWQRERMEGALLRERLNDLAAEVGRLTATLDESGEINAMIDAAVVNGSDSKGGDERNPGSLAERIRALQEQVSRH